MRKIGQEGAGTEVATDREEVRGVLAKLAGGGAVNFESLAAALPQDLRDPEVAQLRTSVLEYFQSAILRGQLDDLRGASVLFERLEIQDVEFSPAYASTLEGFLARVPMMETVSFIMRTTAGGSPGRESLNEREEARKLLRKYCGGDVLEETVDQFLDMAQLLVKLGERGIKKLSGIKLIAFPKLLEG